MRFRSVKGAEDADAAAIAQLHVESWRAHYRGAYRDAYLDGDGDGDVVADRMQVWTDRLRAPAANQFVVLAEEDDRLCGFACAYGRADAIWGTLLDNIHVRPNGQNRGTGGALLGKVIEWCREYYADCGLYLWVLEQNVDAQRFYRRYGAADHGGELSEPPGGGEIHGRRYAWPVLPAISEPLGANASIR